MRSLISLAVTVIFLALNTPLLGFSKTEQKLTGDWQGDLNIGAVSLRLVLHLDSTGNQLTATVDSPDQGAKGITVDSVIVQGDSLELKLLALAAGFRAQYFADGDSISGMWAQGGMDLPLQLTRAIGPVDLIRPQEPQPPYPYAVEDVTFRNDRDSITLAGTLTYPKTGAPFPAAVMITGSGPQNRDEEVFGHKPFKVIADYLSRKGIAVLRFDDRGIGKSTGNFATATSEDFAHDVEAAVAFLRGRDDINHAKIGLIGHSEGGVIAPMVAAQDKKIAFVVLLAGTGVPGSDVLALQEKRIMEATGIDSATVARDAAMSKQLLKIATSDKSPVDKRVALTDAMEMMRDTIPQDRWQQEGFTDVMISAKIEQLMSPWMQFFLKYDPAPALSKVKCPVLVLNGSNDLQVLPDQNLPAIEAALKKGGNTSYKIVKLKGLNHLFQHSDTGSPTEYARIEETFAPEALDTLGNWLAGVVK